MNYGLNFPRLETRGCVRKKLCVSPRAVSVSCLTRAWGGGVENQIIVGGPSCPDKNSLAITCAPVGHMPCTDARSPPLRWPAHLEHQIESRRAHSPRHAVCHLCPLRKLEHATDKTHKLTCTSTTSEARHCAPLMIYVNAEVSHIVLHFRSRLKQRTLRNSFIHGKQVRNFQRDTGPCLPLILCGFSSGL